MLPFPRSRLACCRQDEQWLPFGGHVAHAGRGAKHACNCHHPPSSEQSHLENEETDSGSLCGVTRLSRSAVGRRASPHQSPPLPGDFTHRWLSHSKPSRGHSRLNHLSSLQHPPRGSAYRSAQAVPTRPGASWACRGPGKGPLSSDSPGIPGHRLELEAEAGPGHQDLGWQRPAGPVPSQE